MFRHYSQRVYISLANGDLVVYQRSDSGKFELVFAVNPAVMPRRLVSHCSPEV